MTFDGFERQSTHARSLHAERRYEEAANHYAAAANEMLGASRELPGDAGYVDQLNPDKLGRGLEQLLRAGICFRLSDHRLRAERKCKEGILVVRDIAENEPVFESPARQGLAQEVIGDFRLVGGLEGYDEEYVTASELYATYEEGEHEQVQWQSEPEFEYNISLFLELADVVGYPVSEDTAHDIRVRSLSERIQFKRQAAPDVLEQLLTAKDWVLSNGSG